MLQDAFCSALIKVCHRKRNRASGGCFWRIANTELGGEMGRKSQTADDLQLSKAKARQASKLTEIRKALVRAGYDTTAKQAAVLGVCRSTAWVLLNRDKRVGPSAIVIKRILSSPKLPPRARRKVEEYVAEKICGRCGHSEERTRAFRDVLTRTI